METALGPLRRSLRAATAGVQLPRRDLLLAAVLAAAMAVAALTTSAVGPLPRVGPAVAAVGLLGLALRRRQPSPPPPSWSR